MNAYLMTSRIPTAFVCAEYVAFFLHISHRGSYYGYKVTNKTFRQRSFNIKAGIDKVGAVFN